MRKIILTVWIENILELLVGCENNNIYESKENLIKLLKLLALLYKTIPKKIMKTYNTISII